MYTGDVEKKPNAASAVVGADLDDENNTNNNNQILTNTISNTNVPPPPDDVDNFNPPDGGLLAWSQVLTSLLINCLAWGYPASFGVFQLYYEETLNLPSSQISWIGSCQTFLTFAVCGPAGRLADAGYTRETMLAGSFLAVLGTFMTSLCTQYWQVFLAQGVCTGIGLGVIFMPAVSVLSSYFKKKKAFALALAAMGTGIGSLIFPSTLQYLIPQVGFPWAVRCVGFVALTMTALANLMLRPYLAPRRSGPLVEWDAFTELPYLFFSIGAFLNFYALYFGFFYINVYARNVIGLTSVEAVSLLLIINGMSIPARPLVGYLADYHMGPINTFLMGEALLAMMIYSWIGVKTRTGLYVFSVFFGFANGACQGTFVGANASLTQDPKKMGTRFGMIQTLSAISSLAGAPSAGAIIDRSNGKFIWAQVWGGTIMLLAACFIAASRIASTGWVLRAKK
ncbi:major facilitator superfamily domain-containing protein [Thelonectria olida]|uniref:Major facilitator superfamily domain-containing protein n=1 Tax=Thelonectria olida TaxID=1576542 RepID=A0A9P8WAU3_9HYPO|nr:major facilitator superfamily domain-containing protein [Thelonectria olida]